MIISSYYETELVKLRDRSYSASDIEGIVMSDPGQRATGGKTGALFWFTQKFVIKSISAKDIKHMSTYVKDYVQYLTEMKRKRTRSLIGEIYAIYRFQKNNKFLDVMVMRNILGHIHNYSRIFDLKGSKRKTSHNMNLKSRNLCPHWNPSIRSPEMKTCKHPFVISKKDYDSLIRTIESDSKHLATSKRFDYSLIVALADSNIDDTPKSIRQIRLSEPHPIRPEAKYLITGIVDYIRKYDNIAHLKCVAKSWNPYTSYARNSCIAPVPYQRRFMRFLKIAFQPAK